MGSFNDRWWFWWAPRYWVTATALSGWRFCLAAMAGPCGYIDEAAGADVFQAALFGGGLVRHMARWRVVGGRVPCWLMVAEMSDNSSAKPRCQLTGQTLWRSERCLLRYGEQKKKSNQSLEVDFSYHVRLPLFSTPRPDPMLSSKYLWRSCKFGQIYNVVTRLLFFCSKTPGLFRWSENK